MSETESNVTPLPLTRARATELVREIERAGRWSIVIQKELAPGYKWLVNMRQIDLCLKEGWILDDHAKLDEKGNWRFDIGRVCAGVDVVITVAVERTASDPRLFVLAIRGDVIPL